MVLEELVTNSEPLEARIEADETYIMESQKSWNILAI